MQATLIENNGNGRIAYDSLILNDPKAFSALNSKVALKIVKSLAESPASGIDVSRKLKIHEQKIYYHVRRLERAGIIYTISNERRHGMIAKIYSVVSPVIAAKLYDKGVEVKDDIDTHYNSHILRFFSQFLDNRELNAKIILGNPYPHGENEDSAKDGIYAFDFAILLGSLLKNVQLPAYRTDLLLSDDDLKNNLIIIGSPQSNLATYKINPFLPIYFDQDNNWSVVSKASKNVYKEDEIGIVVKMRNPFKDNKYILLLSGKRSRGTKASIIAITQYTDKILNKGDEEVAVIVRGIDKDNDGMIDAIKFIE